MAADKPKAPERIFVKHLDTRRWNMGWWSAKRLEQSDIEYTRSDLYPAPPEAIGELVAELHSIRDFAASLQYETGAISRGGLQMVVRRMDEALAALTAKEPR